MNILAELLLLEGAFVVKNKDGVEKRFKDKNSEEARKWALSSSKKKAPEKYTQTWWEQKKARDYYGDALYPWSRIESDEITHEFLADASFNAGSIDDWRITKRGEKDLASSALEKMIDADTPAGKALIAKIRSRQDLPTVATAEVRVTVVYDSEDDLGLEDGADPVTDAVMISIMRDPEDPKKLVFGRHA